MLDFSRKMGIIKGEGERNARWIAERARIIQEVRTMLFVVVLLLTVVLCCLLRDHSREMLDSEAKAELDRLEYRQIYPAGN